MIEVAGFRPSHLSRGGPLHPYMELDPNLIKKVQKIFEYHKTAPTPKSQRTGLATISKGFTTPDGDRLDHTIYIEPLEGKEPHLYLILKKLGEGSFAKVNLIVSLVDGILYALRRSKQTNDDKRTEADNHELFVKELGPYVLGCVEILGIGRYHSIPKVGSLPVAKQKMILRFYQVGELLNRSFRELSFSTLCQTLIDGLGAIHARGLVHSDLKPENLFYGWHDQGALIAIGDYGKGARKETQDKLLTHYSTTSLRQVNLLIKEQIADNTQGDDIWALGLTLVELLGDDKLRLVRKELMDHTKTILYKSFLKSKLNQTTDPKKIERLKKKYEKIPNYATPYAQFCLCLDELRSQLHKEKNAILRKIALFCLVEFPPTIEELKTKMEQLEQS
jgi:serine/threonine protein kinase